MKNPETEAAKTCVETGHECMLDEVQKLRSFAAAVESWVTAYEKPVTGIGAGMVAEMLPALTPSARRHLRELLKGVR